MIFHAGRTRYLLAVLGVTAQMCFPAASRGISYVWDGSSSTQFTNSTNWTPAGVPGPADSTTFSLGVGQSYPVLLYTGLFVPVNVTVDRLLVGNNTVTFSGGVLTVDSIVSTGTGRGLMIGQTGGDSAAVVNISALQGLSTVYGTLGANAGDNGTLNVNAGPFNVTGSGATYDLIVGHGGMGNINVSGGADVSVADDTVLGQNATGVGNVSVSGVGSTWANTGDLAVGLAGRGTLNISGGGQVSDATGYLQKSAIKPSH